MCGVRASQGLVTEKTDTMLEPGAVGGMRIVAMTSSDVDVEGEVNEKS